MIHIEKFLNTDGFLKNYTQWNEKIAQLIATKEHIILNDKHWKIIYFLRQYYKINKSSPAIRLLVKSIQKKHGSIIGNSLQLQILFPISPAVQAAKIAGLPKPDRCI